MVQISRMTLEEIAKEIGISRTTIYKVMGNKGNVSEETRRTVNEALEKYHYVKNRNARNLAMNRQYTIGYVGFRSRSANYFASEVRKGLEQAAGEFGDDGLTLAISEIDVEKPGEQKKAVEQMLKQGVRSFILAYSHTEEIRAILTELEEKECLIVLLSRDLAENREHYYVGVDYYQSGRLAAELMGKMALPGEILIPVTREYETNQDILARLTGFQDKMKEFPHLKLREPVFGLLEEEEIYRSVSGSLTEGNLPDAGKEQKCRESQQVTGIFDLTYRLDVLARLLEEQKRTELCLVGFDLFGEIRKYVEDTTIDGLVYQDLTMQAYQAVKILFNEMCYGKRKTEKKLYAKQEIIMKENLAYF